MVLFVVLFIGALSQISRVALAQVQPSVTLNIINPPDHSEEIFIGACRIIFSSTATTEDKDCTAATNDPASATILLKNGATTLTAAQVASSLSGLIHLSNASILYDSDGNSLEGELSVSKIDSTHVRFAFPTPAWGIIDVSDEIEGNIDWVTTGANGYDVLVSPEGTGSGNVVSAGINCGTDCQEDVAEGSRMTFIATAVPGSQFGAWTAGCTSSTYYCTVTVNQATTVRVRFDKIVTIPVSESPTAAITSPTANDTVSGTVNIVASATDNKGIASVQIKVDGSNVGSAKTSAPYSASWDSASVSNGAHIITAVAVDTDGNTMSSAGVSVTVSNGGGGGSSTGGGGNRRNTTPSTPKATTTSPVAGCPPGLICTPISGGSCVPQVIVTKKLPIPADLLTLTAGSRGTKALQLQRLLIQYKYLAAGYDTGYIGNLTLTALNRYKASPQTSTTTIPCPTTPAAGTSSNYVAIPYGQAISAFTRILKIGSTGEDVRQLQKFLNSKGFKVSNLGAGSPGYESTYYGPATAAAVKRFQEAYSAEILKPVGLSVGTGTFGASTMKKVNALR